LISCLSGVAVRVRARFGGRRSIVVKGAIIAGAVCRSHEHRSALATGLTVGFVNALMVARMKILPFIATLSGMLMTNRTGLLLARTPARPHL
jgi:predicted ABC-type sugar transport system permease subunit